MQNQIHNVDSMRSRRKELFNFNFCRSFPWTKLQNSQLEGRKFRRQHSFGSFILDFYCSSEKLCIELDGSLHFTEEGIENDKRRTQYLKSKGINEIRFENWEVFEKTDEVLEKIKSMFKK
jgi:very-short-patch-repair endonuclease